MLDLLTVSASQRSTLEAATAAFEADLYQAQDFLSGRGLADERAVRGHRLGVVSEGYPGFERFAGMLSLPFVTPAGVVAIKFRCILHPDGCEGHPKYNAPEGQQVRLYNVGALHTDGDVVAICEGEIDALVMTELVGIPAVGVPGASNWQPWYGRAFADYETVLVIGDNDEKDGGKNPGLKHARRVVKEVAGARLVLPPAGEDLNSWYLKVGADEIREICGV